MNKIIETEWGRCDMREKTWSLVNLVHTWYQSYLASISENRFGSPSRITWKNLSNKWTDTIWYKYIVEEGHSYTSEIGDNSFIECKHWAVRAELTTAHYHHVGANKNARFCRCDFACAADFHHRWNIENRHGHTICTAQHHRHDAQQRIIGRRYDQCNSKSGPAHRQWYNSISSRSIRHTKSHRWHWILPDSVINQFEVFFLLTRWVVDTHDAWQCPQLLSLSDFFFALSLSYAFCQWFRPHFCTAFVDEDKRRIEEKTNCCDFNKCMESVNDWPHSRADACVYVCVCVIVSVSVYVLYCDMPWYAVAGWNTYLSPHILKFLTVNDAW